MEPPNFTFESMVGDLGGGDRRRSGVEQCDLLGSSHAGAIAIAYAARHPERVRKLVLVNCFAAGWRVRADPEEVAWRNSLIEMNRREWSFRRSLLGEMFITLYFPGADQDVDRLAQRAFSGVRAGAELEAMIEIAADIDVRDELPKIRAQTLVCHSNQDGNAPLYAGKEVADGIAGSRFVELDSANHILLATEPAWQVFVREFRAFLRSP